jgi:hypothetical protein
MVETFDTVTIITAGISAGISILSIYLTKKNDLTLEKLKSKLEIEKQNTMHVEIMNMKQEKDFTKNVNLFSFNLQNYLKVHLDEFMH